ncbi:universal stress protein [Streptomyces buecherae]|uniref:universal stress protein n=1 Tax=Streptomyces buecherae TaxID=2763006 RepID=UPI0036B5FCEB
MMERSLVVGVDGSRSSLRAVDWAADEAARLGLPLRLLHASLWERYEGLTQSSGPHDEDGQEAVDRLVVEALERAERRAPGVKVTADVLPEETVPALRRASAHAYALVVGSRGRGALTGVLLGSVSLAVTARAVGPVIVVRGGPRALGGGFGRVVVGVGGRPDTSDAVRFACAEAAAREAELEAVHAWRQPASATVEGSLLFGAAVPAREAHARQTLQAALRAPISAHRCLTVRRETVEGTARKALLDAAQAADLLVVGARRRGDGRGLWLGRTVREVLHRAPCPVAVVPESAT